MLDSVRGYLSAPRHAVLSTIGSDGRPHQAVVHYWLVDDHLHVNARTDRLWARNLRRDPRVSLVVHDADDLEHWVGIKGSAEVSAEDQVAVDDAVALAVRYGDDPEGFRAQRRVSFRIVAQRLYEYPRSEIASA